MELKQKLLQATLELEEANKLKMELFDLLKVVYNERDELREELTKVLHKIATTSSNNIPEDAIIPSHPHVVSPESLILVSNTKANSSITESNSLSDSSFLDAASSPEFSNMNNNNVVISEKTTTEVLCDPANVIIENLARGKTLPEKGKLSEAVMNAGPLLQMLLVAGPLPSWRNPPPLGPINVPPFALNNNINNNNNFNFNYNDFDGMMMNPHNHIGALISSASVLNFGGNGGGNLQYGSWRSSLGAGMEYHVPVAKRQRTI